jgi:hypothetical protein
MEESKFLVLKLDFIRGSLYFAIPHLLQYLFFYELNLIKTLFS